MKGTTIDKAHIYLIMSDIFTSVNFWKDISIYLPLCIYIISLILWFENCKINCCIFRVIPKIMLKRDKWRFKSCLTSKGLAKILLGLWHVLSTGHIAVLLRLPLFGQKMSKQLLHGVMREVLSFLYATTVHSFHLKNLGPFIYFVASFIRR